MRERAQRQQEVERVTVHEMSHALVAGRFRQEVVEIGTWLDELREADAADYDGMRLTNERPTYVGSGVVRVRHPEPVTQDEVDALVLVTLAGSEGEARVIARQLGVGRLATRERVYASVASSWDMNLVRRYVSRSSFTLEDAKRIAWGLVDDLWQPIVAGARELERSRVATGGAARRLAGVS